MMMMMMMMQLKISMHAQKLFSTEHALPRTRSCMAIQELMFIIHHHNYFQTHLVSTIVQNSSSIFPQKVQVLGL